MKTEHGSGNFLVDTGSQASFSEEVKQLTGSDLGIGEDFVWNFAVRPPSSLRPLFEVLGIRICGLLGHDFLARSFRSCVIDYRNRALRFDVPAFEADVEVGFAQPLRPAHVVVPATTCGVNQTAALVDTGACLCVFGSRDGVAGPLGVSRGWPSITPQGTIEMDVCDGVDLFVSGSCLGRFLFAVHPHVRVGLRMLGVEFVIGANVLGHYLCCFDFENRRLGLKKNPRPVRPWPDRLESLCTAGIQVRVWDGRCTVAWIAPHCPNEGIRVGDAVEIEVVDYSRPEVVNDIYNVLSSTDEHYEVTVRLKGRDRTLRVVPLFSP